MGSINEDEQDNLVSPELQDSIEQKIAETVYSWDEEHDGWPSKEVASEIGKCVYTTVIQMLRNNGLVLSREDTE